MTIPDCGSACFNHTTLYFALWGALVVVSFGALVRALNRMFVPSAKQAALSQGQAPVAPTAQQHA